VSFGQDSRVKNPHFLEVREFLKAQ